MKSYQVILICTLSLGCANDNSGISSDAQLTEISGTYTTALTVQQNACGILVDSVGESRSGISLVITQTDTLATADVRGLAGTALRLATGQSSFSGTVSGSTFDLTMAGTTAGSNGSCAYTVNAHMVGSLTGDAIQGKIIYTYATNKSADCGARDTCQDIQLFSGSRPPKT